MPYIDYRYHRPAWWAAYLAVLFWLNFETAYLLLWLGLAVVVSEGFSSIEPKGLRVAAKTLFMAIAALTSYVATPAIFFTLHLSPCFSCEGHVAGYNWARRKIEDEYYSVDDNGPLSCASKSPSFTRGCEVYMSGW